MSKSDFMHKLTRARARIHRRDGLTKQERAAAHAAFVAGPGSRPELTHEEREHASHLLEKLAGTEHRWTPKAPR